MNPYKFSSPTFLHRFGVATAAALVAFSVVACKSNPQNADQAQIAQQDSSGTVDPAYANMANGTGGYTTTSTTQPTRLLGQNETYTPQQSSADYNNGNYNNNNPGDYAYNDYDADNSYQAAEPPPPIPTYDQPAPPGPDWYWTPGYWAWGDSGYYWVPGTWVEPPYYGALWTPPYWGYYHDHYLFHRGYWGPHVGFYGGVDYGFGYVGIGFFGGYWHGHDFYYNRAVTNVGSVGYYYNRPVVVNNVHYGAAPVNRVSYNGGRGGINIAPRPQEMAARSERHAPPVAAQAQLHETAAHNPAFAFANNHGRPQQAAFARPEAAGVNVPRANEPNRLNEARPNQPGVNPAENQRNMQFQQRTAELQQRNQQLQQRNNEVQQRTANVQQQRNAEAQRNAQLQQHNTEAAQRNVQLQQRNNETAQRNVQMQQRNVQMQQRNNQLAQRNAQTAQRNVQVQQQHAQAAQQRAAQMQQRNVQVAQRAQMQQQRAAPAPRAEAPRPAPVAHVEGPRAAPAPHVEAPHPPSGGGGGEHGHH